MTNPTKRRPLPALVFLVALTLLTSLVWWRVLNRDSGTNSTAGGCTTTTPTGPVLPAPSTVTVAVLNSTDRTGLAKAVAGALTKVGFEVSSYGNDVGHAPIPGVAEIRFPTDQRDAANLLAYYVPGSTMVPLTTAETRIVISLGSTYKRLATAAAVRAALAKDGASIASTAPSRSAGASPSPSPSC